jgi:hypothetical protein
MTKIKFLTKIEDAMKCIERLEKLKSKKALSEYDKAQQSHLAKEVKTRLNDIKESYRDLISLSSNKANENALIELFSLMKDFEKNDQKKSLLLAKGIALRLKSDDGKKETTSFDLHLPNEISSTVFADLEEANKCYEAGCFRSSIILLGRVIETCLHRKLFEVTKKDMLETYPGMGLGKLIAKLRELNINLGPGVSEQIHLINQVRISSVHVKEEAFFPSKDQTKAIMLFTVDVVKKMF